MSTKDELYAALQLFIEGKHSLHVPPEPTDADILIAGAIDELFTLRAENEQLQAGLAEFTAMQQACSELRRENERLKQKAENNMYYRLHKSLCSHVDKTLKPQIWKLEEENEQLREENNAWAARAKEWDLRGGGHDPLTILLRSRAEAAEKKVEELQAQWEQHKKDFHPDWNQVEAAKESIREHMAIAAELRERLKAAEGRYNELIMCVGMKHEHETRHETALRYLRRAEEPTDFCTKRESRTNEGVEK